LSEAGVKPAEAAAAPGADDRPDVEVIVEAEAWAALLEAEAIAARACAAALKAGGRIGSCAILLTDDEAIAALNARFRGKPAPTNVLSFPAAPPPPGADGAAPLGDIAVAFGATAREAAAEGKALADHLAHLVVHGALHLLGHDHDTSAKADEMEALERRILEGLGVADPYAGLAAADDDGGG
jgi:probable rRNA maturation factor